MEKEKKKERKGYIQNKVGEKNIENENLGQKKNPSQTPSCLTTLSYLSPIYLPLWVEKISPNTST